MCGIAGFISNKEKEEGADILRHMLTRIKFRGPDQSGIYLSNDVGLGSVRLSILDIEGGTMPLSNDARTLWIVYNGEVFNYLELKNDLITKGHTFNTTCDTEVILHLYEEYGTECLNMLNGQFAIAIWDTRKKELFLARDRVGIRPIFYSMSNNGFVFASEIKAIFEYPTIRPKLSSKALSQIFTFWTTITPNTVFENIFEVSPGHYLLINENGIQDHTYWELPVYKPEEYLNISLEESIEQFDELFSDSVRLRLRADVVVGAYLSGGIDSSVTTSYVKKIMRDNIKTFSIGFSNKAYDESSFQNIATDFFKTDHKSITCSEDDIARKFPETIWFAETALLRTAPSPMYLLSQLVRENNIKVVITGEGADELLGGYNIFKEAIVRQFWAKYPLSKYRPLLLKKLYPYLPHMNSMNEIGLRLFFGYKLEETQSPIYSHLLRWNNTSHIKNYFSRYMKDNLVNYDPIEEYSNKISKKLDGVDMLSRAQWIEMNLFMSGYLLSSQGDRMAMAHSVEGRYPFLDHRIIDFCMKLPPKYKLNGLNEKYLLKEMMTGKIPDQILNRPKQPYRAPVIDCFISDNSPAYVRQMLSRNQLYSAGIFDPEKVQHLINKLKSVSQVSEIDNMALTGILSTQILDYLFVKNAYPSLSNAELIRLDRIILDKQYIYN